MVIEIRHTEKIASGLLLLLTATVFLLTNGFPSGPGVTTPAFFPRLIVSLIALFALVQLIKAVRFDIEKTHEITASVVVTVGIAAGLVIGYVAVMPFLGFLFATILFLILSMHFSGVERLSRSVPVAVGLALVLHYVFVQFLRVPLPDNPFVPIGRMLPSLLLQGGLV
ncbi:tripartite tricarboxylate transporter TctB family protein (plasmid) [Haloferacaceae archaeon DSL9]